LDRPLLVTAGGVSAGERDFVGSALEALDIQWTLVGAAVKPGKPIRFGRLGNTSVICLPGNPVAALIMGTLVLGCIAATQRDQAPPEWTTVPSTDALQPNAQRELLRTGQVRNGQLHVQAWQGSGDLAHTAGMNAIARLPIGHRMIPAGTPLPVLLT
jgi:molybdopterin molybdotransferase